MASGTENTTARLLRAVDEAMRLEGIPEPQREHVINRVLYGDPHPAARRERAQAASVIGTGITVNLIGPPPGLPAASASVVAAQQGMLRRERRTQ